jgi:parvulin-like peptidyl-prolyl isomerase
MKRVLLLLLFAAPVWADQPPLGAHAVIDRAVAVVNRTPIWQSELDERVGIAAVGATPTKDQIAQALDQMIDEELIIQHAHVAPITDEEINAAVDEIKKQNNIDDAGLDAALNSQHISRAQYRVMLREQIQLQKALLVDLSNVVQVSDDEVQKAFEDMKKKNPALGKLDDKMKSDIRQYVWGTKLEAARNDHVARLRKAAHIEKRL